MLVRTIKSHTRPLTVKKQQALQGIASAYACEKSFWLDRIPFSQIKYPNSVRDASVEAKYKSPTGLQARMWKLALQDAADTLHRHYQAYAVYLRKLVHRNKNLSDVQKHYIHWALQNYAVLEQVLSDQCPRPKFEITPVDAKRAATYLHRIFRLHEPRHPRLKLVRSFMLDADCYKAFKHNGRDYIGVMTLVPRQRINLPLAGAGSITGTVRVVLDQQRVVVHTPKEVKIEKNTTGPVEAIDYGYTEVLTDTQKTHYGTDFGTIMSAYSDQQNAKDRRRNKLRALAKNAHSFAKSRRIRKNNLREAKTERRRQRQKTTVVRVINTALNTFLRTRKPSVVITEELSGAFKYNKGKTWNRRLSSWARGTVQDRTSFKVLACGACHEIVNPAYGSQNCPNCWFVDEKNRSGDRFKCLQCKYEGHADWISTINYLHRLQDSEIHLYTPYRQVKVILMDRYNRRLESPIETPLEYFRRISLPATVPGRTLDTVSTSPSTDVTPEVVACVSSGHSESETTKCVGYV